MEINEEGPIANYYPPNQNQRNKSNDVIAKLVYLDLWRGAGTLHTNDVMRVATRGTFVNDGVTYHNIQVQVNGKQGKSTVAHVNVADTIASENIGSQEEAVNEVIAALNQSLATGLSHVVTGNNP